jgi:thiol-disulfide isomerase/thioredoxin
VIAWPTVIRRVLGGILLLLAVAAAVVLVLYLRNTAPAVRPLSPVEVAASNKPFVIKLHARWCPKCMLQSAVWSQVEQAYAGRVHLMVLDFSNDATTARSRADASRLGLEAFFDEYAGATGFVVVLDRQRKVAAEVGGRDFDTYRAAVEAALEDPATPGE